MHHCYFNGVDSWDLKLFIETLPPRTSPKQRVTSIVIPGRDGTLTQTDGSYDPITREVKFTAMDLSLISKICATYQGAGWLTLDDELDKRYRARVANEISPEYVTPEWRDFTVQFECQPFARELNPQKTVLTAPGILYNIGTYTALPTVKVYGTGNITLTVNGKAFTVQGVTASAVVDCENLVAYEGKTLLVTAGEFPMLQLGKNTISFSGASKIEITPNWRWL